MLFRSQRVALGSSSVFKIAPKMPVMTSSRLPPSSNSSKQTFNILLPVESRHGIPTTQELMDTTIGLAIKNARTLGITNEQFIARIQDRLNEAELVVPVRTTTVTSSSAAVKTVGSPVPLAINTFSLKTVSCTLPPCRLLQMQQIALSRQQTRKESWRQAVNQ